MDSKKINRLLKASVMGLSNKFEIRVENCLVRKQNNCPSTFSNEKYFAFHEPEINVKDPVAYIWEFLSEEDLEEFMMLERKSEVKKYIANVVNDDPCEKDFIKPFVDLMYHVRKFCIEKQYDLERSGAVLSQFYLTHLYFASQFHISAEKVYIYFKKLMTSNSLPFPPKCSKLFSFEGSNEVMQFFCKIYLRNLPLIRFLSLPNFSFQLNYEIPEPEVVPKAKDKKIGADKDKANKKGKKKK